MGLYNMLFGENPNADTLRKMLGLLDDADFSVYSWWPPYPLRCEEGEICIWSPAFYQGFECLTDAEKQAFIQNCIVNHVWITGRYRDICLSKWKGECVICVTTRNGGANRTAYYYIYDILKHHPNYLGDEDDDFDNTYAYIYFSVPKEDEGETRRSSLLTGTGKEAEGTGCEAG